MTDANSDGRPPSSADRAAGVREMLDLPLREGGEVRPSSPMSGPRPPRQRRPGRRARAKRSRPSRGRVAGLGIPILLLVGAVVWILWPKAPVAIFAPAAVDFGERRVGTRSPDPYEVEITNGGERPMVILSVALQGPALGDFEVVSDSCTGKTLEEAQQCALALHFSPRAPGARQARIEVEAEMPDSPASLPLLGEATAPGLAADRQRLDFGRLDVGGASAAQNLRLTSAGTEPLEIASVSVGGASRRDFRVTGNQCSKRTLRPGESCELRIVFEPRAAGERSAQIEIESDSFAAVPPMELVGEGVWTGAEFDVEPRSLSFGEQLVGGASRSRTLQITNRQASTLSGLAVALESRTPGIGIDPGECVGRSLEPGESCKVVVAFSPVAEGEVKALLEVGRRGAAQLGIEIDGSGVAPLWVLPIEAVEFASVRAESKAEPIAVELLNEGSAAAKVSAVALSGPDAKAFRLARDSCSGKAIAVGGRCSVGVEFEPVREGSHEAQLRFDVSAGQRPRDVAVTGDAVAGRLVAGVEAIDFGSVRRTEEEEAQISLTNVGTTDLTVSGFMISGAGAESFRVVGGDCTPTVSLPPGRRCDLRVLVSPVVEGRLLARLDIDHDGLSGPRQLPMAGNGLPPPEPRIGISIGAIDFGPQPVGQRSSIQSIAIRGGGTGKLRFDSFTIEGEAAEDFYVVPATCQASPFLLPGSECGVGVRFTPRASGIRRARLVIRHNAESGVSRVDLIGEGLGPAPGG